MPNHKYLIHQLQSGGSTEAITQEFTVRLLPCLILQPNNGGTSRGLIVDTGLKTHHLGWQISVDPEKRRAAVPAALLFS